jgi:dihydrofolate synthase/folylpolyglutamate synthase
VLPLDLHLERGVGGSRGGAPIILDGAHNLAGVTVLADTLRLLLQPKQKVVFVFGVMKDKPYKAMLEKLSPLAEQFIFYDISLSEYASAYGRIFSAEKLHDQVEGSLFAHCVRDALQVAFKEAKKHELICVCGSLYLLGEVRKYLLGKVDKHDSPDALHNNPDFTQTH